MDRIIIDVREPQEYKMGHVKGAINIPASEIMAGAKELETVDKTTELVVYCFSGNRSSAAMPLLRQLGFTNLVNGVNQPQVEAKYL